MNNSATNTCLPATSPSISLVNQRLTVDFDLPGHGYHGQRFDWTSMVRQIWLDEKRPLLGTELPDSSDLDHQGYGLASEFGLRSCPGYDEADIGTDFTKIGVGVLQRFDDGPYRFDASYPGFRVANHFCHYGELFAGEGQLPFLHVSMHSPHHPTLAWSLQRLWLLRPGQIECRITLCNTGREVLQGEEYCHNFWATGHWGTGNQLPWLRHSLPSPIEAPTVHDPGEALEFRQRDTCLRPYSGEDFWVGNLAGSGSPGTWWEICFPDGTMIRETVYAPVSHLDLWGNQRVLSPELFVPFRLTRNEVRHWIRTWSISSR